MKTLRSILCLLGLTLISSVATAEVRIYGNVSDGPFKGATFKMLYDVDQHKCSIEESVRRGPFKTDSWSEVVETGRCSALLKAWQYLVAKGSCVSAEKTLSEVRNDPFKGGKTLLVQTDDCKCMKVRHVSRGPFKGGEFHSILDNKVCEENFPQ